MLGPGRSPARTVVIGTIDAMIARLQTYARFVKLEHSVFALPMILAGALLVQNRWSFSVVGWVLLAGIGARTVGFALNRIIDKKIDALNPRTVSRELPSRQMRGLEAFAVLLVGLVCYLLSAFFISPICLVFSPLPLLVFLLYPYLKRFTPLAHFGVGLSLALGPLGAGVAVESVYFMNRVPLSQPLGRWIADFLTFIDLRPILLLSLFTFFWVSGFDIIYATLDEAFDRTQGLHSLPAKLGSRRALWVSAALHAAAFVTLIVLYVSYFRTPVAGVVLSATGVLLFLEQFKADDVNLAFFKINGIVSFLVLGFIWAGVAHL
jgi:4-hydroxybenzoate polyprenyltransferase